ncbi:hypothetical protein AMECASPLE_034047 [Ameca splendens]|uniref:Uncharacterized protein n=1 Tax=Ameca splendens TaxID=208324 RepID=A0ABV0XWA9_9TELE
MDLGNDVDLSNNNITPLWKRHTDNSKGSQDLNKPKPRPLSYHVNRVTTAEFPVGDDKCSFTLSQAAERVLVTPQALNDNTMVFRHALHKPSKKNRVVRSISIGRLYNGRFSLSKFKSEDNRSSLDNRVHNGDSNRRKTRNGQTVSSENPHQDMQRTTPSLLDLDLEKDQITSGTNTPSPETPTHNCSLHLNSPHTPNNNHYKLSSQSSTSSSSSSLQGTLTPSHSSTSSIPSLSSLSSSDPPTPRSPSPADKGNSLPRQPQTTSTPSPQDTSIASPSSSICSTSPLLSPTASPSPSIVLSTNSPAALKMGTHQLIPKGLVTDTRQTKAPPMGTQRLALDHPKRALKVLSMVEAGDYFSTGVGHTEEAEREKESLGTLRRGLRSTSYRRALIPHRRKLISQRTFDSEEEELYQNYQEKALHNDSDEDADSRGPKPDKGIVIQYKPIRTSWSQLSVVRYSTHTHTHTLLFRYM